MYSFVDWVLTFVVLAAVFGAGFLAGRGKIAEKPIDKAKKLQWYIILGISERKDIVRVVGKDEWTGKAFIFKIPSGRWATHHVGGFPFTRFMVDPDGVITPGYD
jgi:hypothetical protein